MLVLRCLQIPKQPGANPVTPCARRCRAESACRKPAVSLQATETQDVASRTLHGNYTCIAYSHTCIKLYKLCTHIHVHVMKLQNEKQEMEYDGAV